MAGLLGDTSKAVWFSTSITIANIALNPPISQAADFWGRKWLVVIPNAIAIPGCIIISRASNIGTAIAGFCIMGLAWGSQSLLISVASEILPRKYRGIGQASVNIASGLGGIFGLLVGGVLVRQSPGHFRTFWYITCGIYVVATVGVLVGYNPPPRTLQKTLTSVKLRALDWVGIFLIAAGLTLFAVGLQFYGNPYPFSDAPVLGPFIAGICLLTAFFLYEWLGRADGLVHHGLFGDRNFAIALFSVFTEGLSFLTSNSYFAFEVSVLAHVSLFDAALHFSILFFGAVVFAALAGVLVTHTKSVREPLIFGFVALLAYNACMTSITPSSGTGPFWGFAVLGSIGQGFALTTVTIVAQMSAPPELISVATGLMIVTRSVGATVALAVNNVIFNNSMDKEVPSKVAAAVLPLGFSPTKLKDLIQALLSNNADLVAKVSGLTPEISFAAQGGLFDAYSISFRHVWTAATCFCAAGLLCKSLCYNTWQCEKQSQLMNP